ncbi:MAG: hypothetical protein CMJ48_04910 [Planctomycetaceae bacterium]|nr:hypothetical protein [Planctomycetaceae bacterium]
MPQAANPKIADPEIQSIVNEVIGTETSRVTGKQAGQVFAQVKDPLPRKSGSVFNNESLKNLKKKQR